MIVGAPGSRDDQGRAYLYTYEGFTWKHLEDSSFLGVFDLTESYTANNLYNVYWADYFNELIDKNSKI